MDVCYQVKHTLQAPTPARKFDISHSFGFPMVRIDGRTYGHVITKISQVDRLPNFHRYGACACIIEFPLLQPKIIWVVTCHWSGISAPFSQTLFSEETSCCFTKSRLLSQANNGLIDGQSTAPYIICAPGSSA